MTEFEKQKQMAFWLGRATRLALIFLAAVIVFAILRT